MQNEYNAYKDAQIRGDRLSTQYKEDLRAVPFPGGKKRRNPDLRGDPFATAAQHRHLAEVGEARDEAIHDQIRRRDKHGRDYIGHFRDNDDRKGHFRQTTSVQRHFDNELKGQAARHRGWDY